MKKMYLVIWQLGNNEQSKQGTAVDVLINTDEETCANEIYKSILRQVEYHTGLDNVNVLGVFVL